MTLRRRKSRQARAVDMLRGAAGGRRKSKPARMTDSLRQKVERSGAAKTAQGAGMAGRAAGRGGKAMAAYTGRKAAAKRAPLLVSLPLFAGASIAGFVAVRRMRRGVKQTVPG
jgi:predicted transcriptional regulator